MDDKSLAEKLYSISEVDEMVKAQTSDFRYSLLDVILLLLYADRDPIKGKTRQIKQVFLALKEVLPKNSTQPVIFKPKRFGPYSEEIEYSVDQLAFSNYVSILGKKTSNDFSTKIEKKGTDYIKNTFEGLSPELQSTLREKRHEWDTFTSTGIMNYVYIHNKEFLENAILKKRHTMDWKNLNQLPEKVMKETEDDEDDN